MVLPIKTVELPFEGGLDQKADALWLEAGASLTAQNVIKNKRGSLQHRQGLQAITAAWNTNSLQVGAGSNASGSFTAGRRLTSLRGSPVLFGQGSGVVAQQQIVATLQDGNGLNEWSATDIVPSAYLFPPELVGPGPPITGECDCAVANGLELYVCLVALGTSRYLTVFGRDAALGSPWMRPVVLGTSGTASRPQVIVTAGRYFVVVWNDGAANNILASVFDSLAPTAPQIMGPTRINLTVGDGNGYTLGQPFDVATVSGDTGNFVLLYESIVGGVAHIKVAVITGSTLALVRNAAIDASDAQWTTDVGVSLANAQLSGCAIVADAGRNEIAFSYTWNVLRMSAGIFIYATLVQKESTINLLAGGAIGPIAATNSGTVVSVSFVRSAAGKSTYQTRWSPLGGAFEQNPAGNLIMPYIASWQWSDSGAAVVPNTVQFPSITPGVTLASKDLLFNGIAYCLGYCPSSTQGTFFLFADDAWANTTGTVIAFGAANGDYFPLRLEGIIAPRLSSGLRPKGGGFATLLSLSHIVPNSYLAGGAVMQAPFAQANSPSSMQVARIAFDLSSPLDKSAAELGQNLLVAGGVASGYDGSRFFELGFPYYPVITSITMAGAAGNLSAGTYLYIAQYRWRDTRGQIHLSARSAPYSIVAASTNTATVTIGTLGFTNKRKSISGIGNSPEGPWAEAPTRGTFVEILLYRTQVNANPPVYNNIVMNGGLATTNSAAAVAVTVSEGAADTAIIGNDLLNGDGSDGTQPGNILDNECGPAFQFGIVHQNRYFGIDGKNVWPTKVFTSFAGSAFNEATAFSVDAAQPRLTGAASMDDKLVLFDLLGPFVMTGQGPDDAGQNNDWQPPQRIPSDAGCVDWRSVVTTHDGVYFMSPVGRRLLTRNLQVVPVTQVDDIDTAQPTVTAALIHPTGGRILWTQNTDDAAAPRSGLIVADDYELNAWSESIVGASLGFVSAAAANEVTSVGPPTVFSRALYLLRADGVAMRESPTSNLDKLAAGGATSFVSLLWQSPWIKADGLQGWSQWMEVRVAFQVLDPCGITVTFAYGGKSAAVDTFSYTAAQVAAMPTNLPQLNLQPTRPQESSIQVTITDTVGGGSQVTGAGIRLQGVRIDYGAEPRGGYRTPIAQQG